MNEEEQKSDETEKQPHEPVLLEESYMGGERAKKPPYIFLALIGFVILLFIWKNVMPKSAPPGIEKPHISHSEIADQEDMAR